MCIYSFSNGGGLRFSIVAQVSYSGDKRNGGYKMCIHRFSNGSSC